MITLVHKYIKGRQRRGFENKAELQRERERERERERDVGGTGHKGSSVGALLALNTGAPLFTLIQATAYPTNTALLQPPHL